MQTAGYSSCSTLRCTTVEAMRDIGFDVALAAQYLEGGNHGV
jgi:hypothetical protein